MYKRVLLSVFLMPAFAVAAPFCVLDPGSTTPYCWYYDLQSCRQAAGISGGACLVNSNEVHPDGGSIQRHDGGLNQNPPIEQRPRIKFLQGDTVGDTIRRRKQENAKELTDKQEYQLRQLEIEQRRRNLNRQNIEAPTSPISSERPENMECRTNADCGHRERCRSIKGGGTECRH